MGAFVVVAVLALAAVGCSSDGSDSEGDPAAPESTTTLDPGEVALDAARQRWAEAEVSEYEFEYTAWCSPVDCVGGWSVVVSDGEIAASDWTQWQGRGSGGPVGEPTRIEGLFDMIEESRNYAAANGGIGEDDVLYDEVLGYPLRASVVTEGADDGFKLEVQGFESTT